MSTPTAVFLDTSILDGQQYNFRSTALSTFVPACTAKGVRLLLPEPTEKEIARHIKGWCKEALDALEKARRDAPFLSKWPDFPAKPKSDDVEKLKVYGIVNREWRDFLKQFEVVRLGYDSFDVRTVMAWYERTEAPFREGKKRKEFPDAFSLAMLEAYALKERIYVAVVSADEDFRLACQRFNCLLHFPSLPRLTEVLLSGDARLNDMRAAVEANTEAINDAIVDELSNLTAYHASGLDLYDVEFDEIKRVEPSIVAIGSRECTISVYALLGVEARTDVEVLTNDGPMFVKERIRDEVEIEGTAKMSFPEDGGAASVSGLLLDEYEVRIRIKPWGS